MKPALVIVVDAPVVPADLITADDLATRLVRERQEAQA